MPDIGRLIVIEGPDGVGKTTLARELTSQLSESGIECIHLAFPGNQPGTVGELVYRLHHDSEALGVAQLRPTPLQVLHVASHIDAIESILLPTLSRGIWVILDRFWWSTWVYGLLSGMDHGVMEALIEVERKSWRGITPSYVILIDRLAPWRPGELREKWQPLMEAYRELAKREAVLYPVLSISNDKSIKLVAADVRETIARPRRNKKPRKETRENSQLTLGLRPEPVQKFTSISRANSSLPKSLAGRATEVFSAYWKFAAERQAIFFRRFRGEAQPWTKDRILLQHKFTNAYRASDRVSQFLIRNVIYRGEQSAEEVFFRTILFKLFNRISTWQLLEDGIGEISWREYRHKRYDTLLTKALERNEQIYSAAYIMPPAVRTGARRKHTGHLLLLERMMMDDLPERLVEAQSLRQAFELLRSYPMMGDFLAYQYLIDLNYGPLLEFSEMEFIVPGPGARRGIGKCFTDLGGLSEADVIRLVTESQEEEFARRGLRFESLWGRPLQLIDCQNLFCEVDKYARVAFPNLRVAGGGTRIKQVYRATAGSIEYWYPPKWGLNEMIENSRR